MLKFVFMIIGTLSLSLCREHSKAGITGGRSYRLYPEMDCGRRLRIVVASLPKTKKSLSVNQVYGNLLLTLDTLIFSGRENDAYSLLRGTLREVPASSLQSRLYKAKACGDVFYALKKPEIAKDYYLLLLRLASQAKKPYHQMLEDWLSSAAFVKVNDQSRFHYRTASNYLNKELMSEGPLLNQRFRAGFYLNLFRLNSAAKNYKRSFDYYREYKLISDSLFRQANLQELNHVRRAYMPSGIATPVVKRERKTRSGNTIYLLESFGIVVVILLGLLISGMKTARRKNYVNQFLSTDTKLSPPGEALLKILEEQDRLKEETEELLREAHHKVKNNLQLVMSLLSSQTKYLSNGLAIDVIDESQERLQAMMILHQRLYGIDEITSIDMMAYISELKVYLSGKLSEKGLETEINIRIDRISLVNTEAALLGLFIGEAISNVIKTLNSNTLSCTIAVCLAVRQPGLVRASVTSQISSSVVRNCAYDLGSALMMKALSDQLNGLFLIELENGLTVSTEFYYQKETAHY
ncbi:sensor histidine kinase [Mucilaginibacter celer]|uniref:histidine kinase n=1 Tax=Mucilaginibacter celer TaxID=2305508 RepID=A0A494VHS6_9SPHI|nr:sensor histidine kinase [Mucilaginibacter celer]AYL94326.1 sensor histidine kinase [Mucilaginibacter celer]